MNPNLFSILFPGDEHSLQDFLSRGRTPFVFSAFALHLRICILLRHCMISLLFSGVQHTFALTLFHVYTTYGIAIDSENIVLLHLTSWGVFLRA